MSDACDVDQHHQHILLQTLLHLEDTRPCLVILFLLSQHNLRFATTTLSYDNTNNPNQFFTYITMPRSMAPPPSGEFTIRLQKPFDGKITKLDLKTRIISNIR